ncbi:hypothetical protein, partial [Paenochrobactrum glaciei]
ERFIVHLLPRIELYQNLEEFAGLTSNFKKMVEVKKVIDGQDNFGINAPHQSGPFLHSMANFSSIFERVLAGLCPQAYCEIGVEGQILSRKIIEMARIHSSKVYGIDPTIDNKQDYENYIFIQKPSHKGLSDVTLCDVYFVDGDHNYYTVKGELDLIKKIPSSSSDFPLIFLHDVGWPQDRRDSYYLPSYVPEESRQASISGLGVDPEISGLTKFGLASGDPNYVFADARGGVKNGVLTAVEDFIIENPEWSYLNIPGIFGLCILYKQDICEDILNRISDLSSAVTWLGEIISILEYNRLKNLCETYRTHHHFSLTTNSLNKQILHGAELEKKNVVAVKEKDRKDSLIKELQLKQSLLNQEIAEAHRESYNARRIAVEANNKAEKLLADNLLISSSWSYLIGKIITFPARQFKKIFN